jgi:hypothetical protein
MKEHCEFCYRNHLFPGIGREGQFSLPDTSFDCGTLLQMDGNIDLFRFKPAQREEIIVILGHGLPPYGLDKGLDACLHGAGFHGIVFGFYGQHRKPGLLF